MLTFLKPLAYIFNKINVGIKRLIIVIAVFVTILQLFFYFMNKDKIVITNNQEIKRQQLYEFVQDPAFQETEEGRYALTAYRMFLCYTLGETCTDNPDEAYKYQEQSMITKVGNVFSYPLANPPASGVLWAYEGLQDSGFVPSTYAQGIGFYSLQPLVPIWRMFRNISYMILVFIIVAIGFMIMLRGQINPQMEISITNVLPRIVLTLLLITFSFAIAGFLIDIMYVMMGLGASVITTNFPGIFISDQASQGDFMGNPWWLFGNVVTNSDIWLSGGALLSLVPQSTQVVLRLLVTGLLWFMLPALNSKVGTISKVFGDIPGFGDFISWIVNDAIGRLFFSLVSGLLFPLVLSAIVYVTTLFLFFRIFFLLLTTYVKILISIIFSPLVLLFEAFPERSTFSFWFKGLFFNLMTFPIVTILIMVSGLIVNVAEYNDIDYGADMLGVSGVITNETLWAPPFLYSAHGQGFTILVGLSIMFIIPDIVAFIKKSMGVEDLPFNVTPGTLLAGAGVVGAGVTGLIQRSRAITGEFGIYDDNDIVKKTPWLKIFTARHPFSDFPKQELGSKDIP